MVVGASSGPGGKEFGIPSTIEFFDRTEERREAK